MPRSEEVYRSTATFSVPAAECTQSTFHCLRRSPGSPCGLQARQEYGYGAEDAGANSPPSILGTERTAVHSNPAIGRIGI